MMKMQTPPVEAEHPAEESTEPNTEEGYTLCLTCEADGTHSVSVEGDDPQPVESIEEGLKWMVQYVQEHPQGDGSPEAEHNAAYKQEEKKIGGGMPQMAARPY